jgi:Icc protein
VIYCSLQACKDAGFPERKIVIRIAQISDCHLFAEASKSSYGHIAPYESLAKVLQDIAPQNIDLLLITGDLSADGSAASYQHFKDLVIKYGISSHYVILPGNHDSLAILQQQFASSNLWLHYPLHAPLTLANWQIYLLNTKTQGTGGELATDELAGLSEVLGQQINYFKLVAAHHHPIPCESWMDAHGWQNGAELVRMLQGFDSVKAMVYGHIHAVTEVTVDHCRYLACPSTCWQWAIQPEFGLSEHGPGYRILNLADSGQINTEIFRVEYP